MTKRGVPTVTQSASLIRSSPSEVSRRRHHQLQGQGEEVVKGNSPMPAHCSLARKDQAMRLARANASPWRLACALQSPPPPGESRAPWGAHPKDEGPGAP